MLASTSYPLSAPSVLPGYSLRAAMVSAASRSAVPVAWVVSTSATNPLRFSIRMWLRWRSLASANLAFLYSRVGLRLMRGIAEGFALEIHFSIAATATAGVCRRVILILAREALAAHSRQENRLCCGWPNQAQQGLQNQPAGAQTNRVMLLLGEIDRLGP